ncbi:hypothetical protein Poly51_10320 [Rubripirellula tenax]|uniref:Uncharacterized protein n=1 Tax=Rubripirellula tenax TaxID=2528015 RepID=A0A5C6FGW8_9BACT|nr:hypothetical protein [Rubripirellula tenax]TWU60751.1 hypothetical protein Poly51_10320 [Rubripirellula tenax]
MKRTTIIETIQRQLKKVASESTTSSRPVSLSDLVVRVAGELRREKPDPATVARVIPIEQVAAFVDGNLDAERIDAVCRAVLIDNGVLAELIAAVRTTSTPMADLPAVPESLTQRLMATHPAELISSKDIARMMHEPVASERRFWLRWLLPLAAAAVIAGIVLFKQWTAGPASIVETASVDLVADPVDPDAIVDSADRVAPLPTVTDEVVVEELVADALLPSEPLAGEPEESELMEPAKAAPDADPVVPEDVVSEKVGLAEDVALPMAPGATENHGDAPEVGVVDLPPAKSEPKEGTRLAKPDYAIADVPRWTGVQWSEVTGLAGSAVYPKPPVAGDGAAETLAVLVVPQYQRVMVDAEHAFDSPKRFQTTKLSRAVAGIPGGGQIVLDEDTLVTIGQGDAETSMQVDVGHGEIAIRDVPLGSALRIRRGATPLGTIVFNADAMVIARAIAGGIELSLAGASVKTDDGWFSGPALRVTAAGATKIAGDFDRSAEWISKGPVTLDKVYLGQIGDSSDLAASLATQINRLSASARLTDSQTTELAKLIQMRLSLSSDRIFGLVANRFDGVRRAAVESIALLSKNDPRYETVWATIERSVANPAMRSQVESWMRLVRTGGQPNSTQLQAMLRSLDSPSPAVRGLGDVMLRYYVSDPPEFDPNSDDGQIRETKQSYQTQLADP